MACGAANARRRGPAARAGRWGGAVGAGCGGRGEGRGPGGGGRGPGGGLGGWVRGFAAGGRFGAPFPFFCSFCARVGATPLADPAAAMTATSTGRALSLAI